MDIKTFYRDKTVLITGHTGFKGTWLTRMLLGMGAKVIGYALEPMEPSLYQVSGFSAYEAAGQLCSVVGDVRDYVHLSQVVTESRADILFHLAAQPIVRESYNDPMGTYETNVMGTVHFMEAIRTAMTQGMIPKSVVVITTDKVYLNKEQPQRGYREEDPLDGFDPYSNSKSCAELVVHSYRSSFFRNADGSWIVPISTMRAGNVIGGGDFAKDRIIPDCVRAVDNARQQGRRDAVIAVRNPYSTRPFQHVLEPLTMYLTLAMRQAEDQSLADWYNVGPEECDCVTTGELVTLFCEAWNAQDHEIRVSWENRAEANAPHEAGFLKLDSTKLVNVLGYQARWHIQTCIEKTVEFSKIYLTHPEKIPEVMDLQINEFLTQ
ncbi:MAG: CDP-glucose 4,6-dehydratase [Lachnospiraceae bacterium]|nr:CDP-glucose 4,6-dehydratase [Lachnospiraceae bacterium]